MRNLNPPSVAMASAACDDQATGYRTRRCGWRGVSAPEKGGRSCL